MPHSVAVIQDLEQSIASDSLPLRLEALTRMSDLFLVGSARLPDDLPVSCDTIVQTLTETIEAYAAGRAAKRKAMSANAESAATPRGARRRLSDRIARHRQQDMPNDDRLHQSGLYQTIARHDFLKLLGGASDAVRARMIANNPHPADINAALADITGRISDGVRNNSQDHAHAIARIKRLQRTGQFREADLHAYASANDFESTVVALTALGDFRIDFVERALLDRATAAILILARAAQLCRTTVRAILTMPAADRRLMPTELLVVLQKFDRLQLATARNALEFCRLRDHAEPKAHASADLALEWYVQSIPARPSRA